MGSPSPVVLNIMVLALRDEAVRAGLQKNFDRGLKALKLKSPLSKEDYNALKMAFRPSDVSGQCSACAYDMSCGQRGFYN